MNVLVFTHMVHGGGLTYDLNPPKNIRSPQKPRGGGSTQIFNIIRSGVEV